MVWPGGGRGAARGSGPSPCPAPGTFHPLILSFASLVEDLELEAWLLDSQGPLGAGQHAGLDHGQYPLMLPGLDAPVPLHVHTGHPGDRSVSRGVLGIPIWQRAQRMIWHQ